MPEYSLVMRLLLIAALASISLLSAAQPSFDVLILNGRVLDGSGNPWRRADIGIRGDRIVAVGRLTGATAALVIDAKDRVVAPGFIDVHSHALGSLTQGELREARALVAQGVTTRHRQPGWRRRHRPQEPGRIARSERRHRRQRRPPHRPRQRARRGDAPAGQSRGCRTSVERRPPRSDAGRARPACARSSARPSPTARSGLSSGLFYAPGRYAKTEEVIALAREAGGVYTSHIRDEGDYDVGVVASVDEVIRVAEEARVRGVVSHMKALGPDNWGKSATMIEHIEAARARGVEVFADQYPYEASSTSLGAAVMPGECRDERP